jgi:uncharacterized pyridoxamine 5'-phosphate oxidase family protein
MNEIVDFLKKSHVQYLASIGLDGKPKVRPFQFMFEEESKLWFCTSNQKEIYRELKKLPFIELCASGKNMSWLRIEAKVIFDDNLDIKQKVFECSPLVKGIYKNPNNPEFEVFYLSEGKASISEIGKPPIYYSL